MLEIIDKNLFEIMTIAIQFEPQGNANISQKFYLELATNLTK